MKNELIIILATRRKTVADVHDATGLSKATITNIYYENAKNPEIQTLLKICNYLDVTVDQLLGPSHYVHK